MTDKQLREVIVQARRILLKPASASQVKVEDVPTLLLMLAAALCKVAPDELMLEALSKEVEVVDRLDTSPKPVTISSH